MKLTLIMAVTADGLIARSDDHFPDWTGREDKKLFVNLTRKAGVIIMGSKTFDTLPKPLPGRKNIVMTRNTARKSKWDHLVYTQKTPSRILSDLEAEGYESAVLAGGGVINSLFARHSLIDEIYLTVCPKLFGRGLTLFARPVEMDLTLLAHRVLDDEGRVLLHYSVDKKTGQTET